MKQNEAAKIVAVLKAAYPNHPVDTAMVTAYQMALDDVPYDEGMTTAARHIKTSPFFPRPSELREMSPVRMDPRDYLGDAYLDVPWMKGSGGLIGATRALDTAGTHRKAG